MKTVFACLAKYYGWTYQAIADMTPYQCSAAIEAASTDDVANNTDSGIPGIDGKLHFSTRDQWELWKQTRGLK